MNHPIHNPRLPRLSEEYGQALDRVRLLSKAFSSLKLISLDETRLAKAFHDRRLKFRVLNTGWKVVARKLKMRRRYNRNVKEITKLFRLKLLLKAWKE